MANVIYGQMRAFYNGTAMEQNTSISMRTESGIVPVETMLEGLAGFTIGSGRVTLEIAYNIPATGTEFDFQEDAAEHIDVLMQISRGGKSYAGIGKIENVDENQSSGETLSGTFTWIGPLQKLE